MENEKTPRMRSSKRATYSPENTKKNKKQPGGQGGKINQEPLMGASSKRLTPVRKRRLKKIAGRNVSS